MSIFDKIIGVLDDLADMAALGSNVAKNVKSISSSSNKEDVKTEAKNRVTHIQEARKKYRESQNED